VFVPDPDVARRMRRHLPSVVCHVRPHPDISAATPVGPRQPRCRTGRRIALIGGISRHKGSQVLLDCAQAARDLRLPLEFIVLGHTDIDRSLSALTNVSISGRYAEADLQRHLAAADADIAWFPAVWPETYSYTLSAALSAGIFPAAFDFGAIASRLRAVNWGELMPIEWMLHPDRVAERLAYMPLPPPPEGDLLPGHAYPDILSSYYGFVDSTARGRDAARSPALQRRLKTSNE
jgi:glycosyltransferase involved in cell wall biosynthesis